MVGVGKYERLYINALHVWARNYSVRKGKKKKKKNIGGETIATKAPVCA